jgi:undecaprenyl-diphosphatase
VLIGVVEGLTEFLPVSSTGHIILAEELLHFQGPPGKVFEIVIQLGAILAVCFLYRVKIWTTVQGVLNRDPVSLRFAGAVIVAFLPAAVVGVAAHKYIKSVLFDPKVVAVALIVGGIAILVIERYAQRPRMKSLEEIDLKTAFLVGLCQCLAMIPGVSRAGATIMGARVFRVDRATAAEFSFFLAMPTMVGAFAFDLYKNWALLTPEDVKAIAIGFAVSFVAGAFVVRYLLDFVSRHGFSLFAWWRIAVGGMALGALVVLG